MTEDAFRSMIQEDIEFFFSLLDAKLDDIESSSNLEELDSQIGGSRKILQFLKRRMSFLLASRGVNKIDGGLSDFESIGNY